MASLQSPPAVQWGASTGLVQELYYSGEPLDGKPTRIFAYLGRPAGAGSTAKRHPAMVLVHGGGGTAFREWAERWAQRGYVALAMDLAGRDSKGRLSDGGPDQADAVKFRNFADADVRDMWTYHAVAAVVRGHSLVRALPEVDAERVGLTGISWGGYLTCIVAGIDPRFKVAVPVYGCGFLGDNSAWRDNALAKMTPEARARWLRWFDPGQYVGAVRYPILFVNGTTDFAYPLDSYQKTYRLVPARWRHVAVTVNLPHGHIWTFPEVDAFVDSVLANGPALARIGAPEVRDGQMRATVTPAKPALELKEYLLCYTTNSGTWQKRQWTTIPARMESDRLVGRLPAARPLVAFLAVKDAAGNRVSSEHVELGGEQPNDRP
jgi:dienelactone hydrolase